MGRAVVLAAFVLVVGVVLLASAGSAEEPSPFEKLFGRWVGEGRLGMRNGTTENVKCRVTYVLSGGADEVRQTIRCASAGGSVEVQSVVTHASGALSGSWKELVRDMSGDLKGTVTPNGFRVSVRGADLSANMEIIVKDANQLIAIQFRNSVLIGMTLVLAKG